MKEVLRKMVRDAEMVGLLLLGIGLTIAFVTMIMPNEPSTPKKFVPIHRN
jgi:hypothetical protein